MYSRIPRQPPRPVGVPSYRRQVTPPPNYSGNAFPAAPAPDGARPRFDELPTLSTLPARDMPPAPEEPIQPEEPVSESDRSDRAGDSAGENIPPSAPPAPDVPGAALPGFLHFPFGHGLGQEELLLLGLMLLLLYEGRAAGGDSGVDGDGDLFLTLTLLGFLLVCG